MGPHPAQRHTQRPDSLAFPAVCFLIFWPSRAAGLGLHPTAASFDHVEGSTRVIGNVTFLQVEMGVPSGSPPPQGTFGSSDISFLFQAELNPASPSGLPAIYPALVPGGVRGIGVLPDTGDQLLYPEPPEPEELLLLRVSFAALRRARPAMGR